jgi:hypothetical protein
MFSDRGVLEEGIPEYVIPEEVAAAGPAEHDQLGNALVTVKKLYYKVTT